MKDILSKYAKDEAYQGHFEHKMCSFLYVAFSKVEPT